jgi:hypothetical protein
MSLTKLWLGCLLDFNRQPTEEELAEVDEESVLSAFQDRSEPCPDNHRSPYITPDEWAGLSNEEKWLEYFTWGDQVRGEPSEEDLCYDGLQEAPSGCLDIEDLPF